MADKTVVLITGGNAGLGLEIVKSLLSSGDKAYHILLGGRSLDKAIMAAEQLKKNHPKSKSTVETVQVDISADESIQACFESVSSKYDKIDILINNAGVSLDMPAQEGKMTKREAWTEMWNTNVYGTEVMTSTFAPLLLKSEDARLLFITSGTSSIEEASKGLPPSAAKPPAGWPKPHAWSFSGYRASKAALNMLAVDFCRIFKEDGVKVYIISPGFLATNLGGLTPDQLRKMGARDPQLGANFIRDCVEGVDKRTGKVIRLNGDQPW